MMEKHIDKVDATYSKEFPELTHIEVGTYYREFVFGMTDTQALKFGVRTRRGKDRLFALWMKQKGFKVNGLF